MKVRKCEECIRRKTMYCPNTKICYSTENKPYYLDNIMANEVIEKLKNEIDKKDKVIDEMAKEIEKQQKEIENSVPKEAIRNISNHIEYYLLGNLRYKDSQEQFEYLLKNLKEILGE